MNKVQIQYFSDVMCVWAYIAQARLDELQAQYKSRVSVSYHFVSVYGNTQKRVVEKWAERGGIPAYIKFVRGVANEFGHVDISENFWRDGIGPYSSAAVHLFLKAAAKVCNVVNSAALASNKTLYEELIWQCRKRYFSEGLNIGLLQNQLQIATDLGLDAKDIRAVIEDGSAYAELCEDNELKDTYHIEGSPTYVLNEGRQKLYGNVGYKIIAANVEELLNRPEGVASWC